VQRGILMICRNSKCPWNKEKQCGNPLPVINEAAMCDVIFKPDGLPRHVDEFGISKAEKEIDVILDGEIVERQEVEENVESNNLGGGDSGDSDFDLSDASESPKDES
jgi:hypothetical protein